MSLSPEAPDASFLSKERQWHGQKWEYLVLRCYGEDVQKFVGRTRAGKGFLAGDEDVDPTVAYYNQKLEEIGTANRRAGNLTEVLRIVGDEGWELTTSMVTEVSVAYHRVNYLLFKRPASPSK